MKVQDRRPRLPAEWEPQRSVWLTWPGNPETWPNHRNAVLRDHARLVATCTRFQAVDLICGDEAQSVCRQHLTEAGADVSNLSMHAWPVDDAWTRDHGPLFVQGAEGMQIVDLPFQGWGNKFPAWQLDDQIARRVSEVRNQEAHRFPYFGEGGGLESNGQGVLLVTESVWLNPNRNPGVSIAEVENAFREFLGIEETIWLSGGMASDDTDGHIDTLARFADPNTVLAPRPAPGDPDEAQLMDNLARLECRFEVVSLPHPTRTQSPASYANFVILNGGVLVPLYGGSTDAEALSVLAQVFPDREVVGVPSETFVQEGGAVHCLTCTEYTQGSTPESLDP